MNWSIKAEVLGKDYELRHQASARYVSLREVIGERVRALLRGQRAVRIGELPSRERFWALRDVSFEIGEGERVGIIGRNGAGKSTLLKILSRVTDPSRGKVRLRGRVASLLEVGTGFHPELTGRENVFLNGAILGMPRGEIRRKFDAIVAFAEVERFLDTPVKRYSSGMYMRLAFAVAAHLDSEILVVDEVLAVGDATFQKKCIAKMQEVGRSGRTVLFVSHNMGTIAALCERCMLLAAGRLEAIGPTPEVVARYNRIGDLHAMARIEPSMRNRGDGRVQFQTASIADTRDKPLNSFLIGEDLTLDFQLESATSEAVSFWLIIFDAMGRPLLSSHQRDAGTVRIEHGRYRLRVRTRDLGLMPGTYTISAGAFDERLNFLEWVDNCQQFEVLPSFRSGVAFDGRWGAMNLRADWELEPDA